MSRELQRTVPVELGRGPRRRRGSRGMLDGPAAATNGPAVRIIKPWPDGPTLPLVTASLTAPLHAGGLLEAITVPNEQVEALRDLVRAREDARIDRMRDRHRMSKFLLRHGLRMPNKSWGVTRRAWLGSLTFPCPGTVAGGRVRSIAVRPTGGSTCSST